MIGRLVRQRVAASSSDFCRSLEIFDRDRGGFFDRHAFRPALVLFFGAGVAFPHADIIGPSLVTREVRRRSSSISIITPAATGSARIAPSTPISKPPARSANSTTEDGSRSARP